MIMLHERSYINKEKYYTLKRDLLVMWKGKENGGPRKESNKRCAMIKVHHV